MEPLMKYVILFLSVQLHLYEVCAGEKDDFRNMYNFVAGLQDYSENMLEYVGKIQAIFCPEQPICYEQDKCGRSSVSNNMTLPLMIGDNTTFVGNITAYIRMCCLPCSCTDSCLEDNNCCLTKSFASNTSISHDNIVAESANETISEESIRSECIGASSWNYFKRLKNPHTVARYRMVTRCFVDRSNESVVSKCETPTFASFEETIPVTSNTTGRIYWNKYRALCNNDKADLVTWNLTAVTDNLLFYVNISGRISYGNTLDAMKTFDDLHKGLNFLGNILFTPPTNMTPKRCFPKSILLSCEQNGTDIIYTACKQFHSPVYSPGNTMRVFAYMNIFCLLCSQHTLPLIKRDTCTLQESKKSLPGAVTSLLDCSSSIGKVTVSYDYTHNSHKKKCRCDEFLDPYEGFCRPQFCPFGELLVACRCVQPVKNISGMPVLKLKVTVDPGKRILSTDVLMKTLRTAITKFLEDTVSQISVRIAAILRPMTNETEYYLCLAIVSTEFGYDTKETLKPFLGYLDSERYEEITIKRVTFSVCLTHRLKVWTQIHSESSTASFSGVDLKDHYALEPVYLNEEVMRGRTRRGVYQIFSPLLYCTQIQLNGNESLEQNGILTVNTPLSYLSVWDYHRVTPQEIRICINEYLPERLHSRAVLTLLESNPGLAEALLLWRKRTLTADAVLVQLKPNYSVVGSEKRGIEELVMVQLNQFLRSAEDGDLKNLILDEEFESEEMRQFVERITPGHILAYATYANQCPASGFREHPKITFVHDSGKFIPAANTCSYELVLFANDSTVTELFHLFMVKALMNGVVFSIL